MCDEPAVDVEMIVTAEVHRADGSVKTLQFVATQPMSREEGEETRSA